MPEGWHNWQKQKRAGHRQDIISLFDLLRTLCSACLKTHYWRKSWGKMAKEGPLKTGGDRKWKILSHNQSSHTHPLRSRFICSTLFILYFFLQLPSFLLSLLNLF